MRNKIQISLILIIFYLICPSFAVYGIMEKLKNQKVECPVIGISLGTTNSCVGVFERGYITIIPNELSKFKTPSELAFNDEEILAGEFAKSQEAINNRRTIYDVKRLIGRKYTDTNYEILEMNDRTYIRVKKQKGENELLRAEKISAIQLVKMKEIAETYLGKTVQNAVITVPAYFNHDQRQSTKDAGSIAGLNVLRILNEPIAAAIAYGFDKQKGEKNILVYHLGGGTFDVSIVNIYDGVFEVITTSGDANLGGTDFDKRVMDYFIKLIKKKYNKDISLDKRAIQKLKRDVENAKKRLYYKQTTQIEIENLVEGLDFSEELTRDEFQELNSDLFNKTLSYIQIALEDSGLKKSEIDEIILVGGSTKIPKIRKLVQEFFGKEPYIHYPDETIAYGAATEGANICGEIFEEYQAYELNYLSFGIETAGGVMSKIVPRFTKIPTKKSNVFTTDLDNQEMITIKIFEGERPMTKDNHLLGQFDLTGLPAAPKGQLQIEVTFKIDLFGKMVVKAKEISSNIQSQTTILDSLFHLSNQQINNILESAQSHSAQDEIIKKRIEARNSLDSYISYLRNRIPNEVQLNTIHNLNLFIVKNALLDTETWFNNNRFADEEEYSKRLYELESKCKTFANLIHQQYRGNLYSLSFDQPNSDL